MSKKYKFKLNKAGVKELLHSSDALAVCKSKADEIRGRCGDGWVVTTGESHSAKGRVNASVYAETVPARQDNYNNHTLERALY